MMKKNHEERHKGKHKTEARIKIYCVLMGVISFLLCFAAGSLILRYMEKEQKDMAMYTAKITASRVEMQLEKYVQISDFMANRILAGDEPDQDAFSEMAKAFPNEDGVVKAYELAPNGVVTDIYPMQGNEKALSLNLLTQHERYYDALRAKETGKYTLGGPYTLKQGGQGALLFTPVYLPDGRGHHSFWGFVVIVIDWQKFLNETGLDQLSRSSFLYEIWTHNNKDGQPVTIASGQSGMPKDRLTVTCEIPNAIWYFDIMPVNGWIPPAYWIADGGISGLLAILIVTIFYQFLRRRCRETEHAAELQRSAYREKSANEAKTRFLFNMSHDIRTPMNAIAGFASLLEKHLDRPEKAKEYLTKMQVSSALLTTIIDQVLEMARIESGTARLNLSPEDLMDMWQSVETVFEADIKEKQLHFSSEVEIQHRYVLCDKTRVQEIFLNIVSNAIKYTPAGQAIHIKLCEVPPSEAERARYIFTCQDTGIGMSQDYLPHIFEEFSRERSSTENQVIGTGLGLSIVKSMIELMGGAIHVESRKGCGTCFHVDLPLHLTDESEVKREETEAASDQGAALTGKRILLAEDNDLNAEIACELLEEKGILVERAEDGQVCCDRLIEAADGYYDLILMDIQMPHMNGYEATRRIRKLQDPKKSQIPIIAMTANAFAEDRLTAKDAGMNDHVAKPIHIDILLSVLKKYV